MGRAIILVGPDNIRGGIKGYFPVNGHDGRFEFLNRVGKFLIDSLITEKNLATEES